MEELTLIDGKYRYLYSSLLDYTYRHADHVEFKAYHISERLLIDTLHLGKRDLYGYILNEEIISFLIENYEIYRKIDLKFYHQGEVIYEHSAKTGSTRFAYEAYFNYIKDGHEELLNYYCF